MAMTQTLLSRDTLLKNISLASHSSWLVGGEAEFFIEPSSIEELKEIYLEANQKKTKITILGGGTNVLISDNGIKGLVVSLGKLTGIEITSQKPDLEFWAYAGTTKSELLKLFLKHKLQPAGFLAGLPGQVGGGVVMNAGVGEKLTPREFVEITKEVEVLKPDGDLKIYKAQDLKWSYRHCHGWEPGIITRAKLTWPHEPNDKILEEVKALNKTRLQKQPLEWPSCGSVFRNPLPKHAGQLIEQAGLKGFTIGGAQVSEKHANFIINKDNAQASDIKKLIEHCQKTVKDKFQIDLQTEVVFLGEF